MAGHATQAVLERYANVLRGFGLTATDIRSVHGLPAGAPLNLQTLESADAFERTTSPIAVADLEANLRSVIADADLGIEAPRRYWNELPPMQLRPVVDHYGGAFAVPDETSDHAQPAIVDGTTIEIVDTDTETARRTTFEYPDTALDDDNYPALLATIETELLGDTHLHFVQLTNETDDWLFALVDERRLDALRERYGDRIQWGEGPLLAEHQPVAYDRDVQSDAAATADCPRELVPRSDADSSTAPILSRSTTAFENVTDDVDADQSGTFDHGRTTGPSVDDLVAADDPVAIVEDDDGTATASDGGTVVATDAEIDDLFATMDETTLDDANSKTPPEEAAETPSPGFETTEAPSPGIGKTETKPDRVDRVERLESTSFGVETADTEPLASGAAADLASEDGSHALDDAFAELGREAARLSADASTDADDDAVTSGDILDELAHENVGDDATTEDGFMWLDPEELTPVPGAVIDAASTEL